MVGNVGYTNHIERFNNTAEMQQTRQEDIVFFQETGELHWSNKILHLPL
jgi:hypothetical protein